MDRCKAFICAITGAAASSGGDSPASCRPTRRQSAANGLAIHGPTPPHPTPPQSTMDLLGARRLRFPTPRARSRPIHHFHSAAQPNLHNSPCAGRRSQAIVRSAYCHARAGSTPPPHPSAAPEPLPLPTGSGSSLLGVVAEPY